MSHPRKPNYQPERSKYPLQRQMAGTSMPSIWPLLQQLWQKLDKQYSRNLESPADTNHGADLERLIMSTARFTRNLVAGVFPNQLSA